MNRQESRYFRTAMTIDEAFLEILETKDMAYITVTELCKKAGVNRSTFYLHYENLSDVLAECGENLSAKLDAYYPEGIRERVGDALVTTELVKPYLAFLKDHKKLFQSVVRNAGKLSLPEYYQELFETVFDPAMESRHVPEWKRKYVSAFHIEGMAAIAMEWLRGGCKEDIDDMAGLILSCVTDPGSLVEKAQTP